MSHNLPMNWSLLWNRWDLASVSEALLARSPATAAPSRKRGQRVADDSARAAVAETYPKDFSCGIASTPPDMGMRSEGRGFAARYPMAIELKRDDMKTLVKTALTGRCEMAGGARGDRPEPRCAW